MEPIEQIENVFSADGVASAYAQVQDFQQEINRMNLTKATSVIVREEYLTPIVHCLPGDSVPDRMRRESSRTGVYRSSSRPMLKGRSNRPFAILSRRSSVELNAYCRRIRRSRSEGTFLERNSLFLSETTRPSCGDVLQQEQKTNNISEMSKSDKIDFVPRRTGWIVYSLPETRLDLRDSDETPQLREDTTAEDVRTLDSDLSTYTADEGESDRREATLPTSTEVVSATFTLKDIIDLARKVFQENEEIRNRSDLPEKKHVQEVNPKEPSLGYYLQKLMEEKRNYLDLQKTNNFRKAQKVNFIADSFHFFNLLNNEFLCARTSNPSIEELRSIIAENRGSKMEEYLDMYRKVIKTSMTERDQCLMDKAKMNLEQYADLYYDLMKCICSEKEKKEERKEEDICTDLLGSAISGTSGRINYYEILKENGRGNLNFRSGYLDKIKPKTEKTFHSPNRKNREFNIGRTSYRTNCIRRPNTSLNQREQKSNGTKIVKQVVELLSPLKNKETTLKKNKTDLMDGKKEEENNQGKVLLQISLCNESLVIKQVKESSKEDSYPVTESIGTNSTGLLEENTKNNADKSVDGSQSYMDKDASEANLGSSVGTSSEEIEKTRSESLMKTESNVTTYPKGSLDDDSKSQAEHPLLKFRVFRKLLNEGLKLLTSSGGHPETECQECLKALKGGGSVSEKPIRYPRTKIFVRETYNRNPTKYHEGCKPIYLKNISTKETDKRQTMPKSSASVRPKTNEAQKEKMRKNCKKNPTSSKGGTPNKINRKEVVGERKKGTNLWWRSDRSPVGRISTNRLQKSMRDMDDSLANGLSLMPQILAEASSISSKDVEDEGSKREQRKGSRKEDGEEIATEEIESKYSTPIGSHLDWRSASNIMNLQNEIQANLPNPTERKLVTEELEEKELEKMDLSYEDVRQQDSEPEMPSNEIGLSEKSLPLRADWDNLLEASFRKDYQKMSEVLNQFMGNITEAWKSAMHLKDLIATKSMEERPQEEVIPAKSGEMEEKTQLPQEKEDPEQKSGNKAVERIRQFLRISMNVFENYREEASVRKELFLVMKELVETSSITSSVKAMLNEIGTTENRTIFHREIARIPEELRGLIAEALISRPENFSTITEDYEPGGFVSALKEVCEKLKSDYFVENSETQEVDKERVEETPEEKKIYYHPPKDSSVESHESVGMISNLNSLAEKINQAYSGKAGQGEVTERKEGEQEEVPVLKKFSNSHSSIYFDAIDRIQQSAFEQGLGLNGKSDTKSEQISLEEVDENYFKMSGKAFGKYRNFLYDKIIAFIKSDNPENFNYGMTLLSKMMEKDEGSLTTGGQIVHDEWENWHDIVDKLMEMCQVIEFEMDEQEEKLRTAGRDQKPNEKVIELVKTCEHLKNYVHKVKIIMEEMKRGHLKGNSAERVRAFEDSRRTNKERQLLRKQNFSGKSFLNQKYLDNAIAFINSFGTIGGSVDKFAKTFLPDWLNGRKEEKESAEIEDEGRINEEFKDSSDPILDCNRAFVMNLKKTIDKKQKKIKELIEEAAKKGITREESLTGEKLSRKVKDLKKCYGLLDKVINDPTMIPEKWLKMTKASEDFHEEIENIPEKDLNVMTVLQEIISGVKGSKEINLAKKSQWNQLLESKRQSPDQLTIELMENLNFANFDWSVESQGQKGAVVFHRPKTI